MNKYLKFILQVYKPYLKLKFLAISGSLFESVALTGLAYIIKNVVDDVFIAKSYEKLTFVIVVLIILALLKQVGFIVKDYGMPLVIYKASRDLRFRIYEKILNASPSVFRRYTPGDLIGRAVSDIEKFGEIVSRIATNMITEAFTIIGICAVLIYRDWKLFLIFVLTVPFLAWALNHFGEKRKRYSRKVQESIGEYIHHLNQILSGIEVVKLFKKNIFLHIFNKINERLYERQKKNKFYETIYLSTVEIIAYTATAGIIFYGGIRIINGDLTPGDFFSFLGGVLILVNSLQAFQRGAVNIKALSPVVDRLLEVLNLPQEEDKGIEFTGLKDKIQYQNVSLSIDGNQILKNINLTICKGENIGIVGPTGSGKSTLVKILPALITEYEGKVLIDNHELREYSLSSLRDKIGMVSQEVIIFNDTLRNNLLVAKPDATEEELIEALKKARADFAFKLENGLDTVLGEKGSRLSGGERQRIAIARIFLKNPDILIVDEGTSALDVETEEYIMEEIDKHFKDRTVIIITHRLKLLDITDKVIVIEGGQIVEEGTKEELLKQKGVFYRFSTISS